jgi:hypothetical protein
MGEGSIDESLSVDRITGVIERLCLGFVFLSFFLFLFLFFTFTGL